MAKVYLRADENEAGATVREAQCGPVLEIKDRYAVGWNEAEARAVVEGLLRRMLEREGEHTTFWWFQKCIRRWEEGR